MYQNSERTNKKIIFLALPIDEKLNITNRVIVNTSQQSRLSNSDYKSTITAEHRNKNI